MPFKDVVSRKEAVGPAGQPSEAAQERYSVRLCTEYLIMIVVTFRYRKLKHELEGGELELVAETGMDAIRKEPPKAFTLYAQVSKLRKKQYDCILL